MIKLLTIEGCGRCNKFKEILNKEKILYNIEDCSGESSICDAIERFANSELYPIVLLMESSTKIKEIAFLTNDYNRLGKKEDLGSGVIGIPYHSIDELIKYAINSYIR